jgi:hypothetical protein
MLIARRIDHGRTLNIALAVAGGLTTSVAPFGVAGVIALCIATTHALAKAVVDAGDVDASIAVAFAGNRTFVLADGLSQERTVFATDGVQLGSTRLLVHA